MTDTVVTAVMELPGLPDYPYAAPSGINAHGVTVGWASGTGYRAVRWSAEGAVTDLGALPGHARSWAVGVNDHGVIAGMTATWDDASRKAVRWDEAGAITELPGLPGYSMTVLGINHQGTIIGYGWGSGLPSRAVRWDRAGRLTELTTLGGSFSRPTAMNRHGTIIGFGTRADESLFHPVCWDVDGTITELPVPAGFTGAWAQAINDHGMIIGYTMIDDDPRSIRPVRWDAKGTITELPSPSGRPAQPVALNDHGTIIGSSAGSLVLWDAKGTLIELHSPGYAEAVNNDGLIVGYMSRVAPSIDPYDLQAMCWDTQGNGTALSEPPGYTSTRARFVNDRGVIVGYGHRPYDQDHAILWRAD